MSDRKKLIKATATGLLCGILTNVILMCLLALALTKAGLLPPDILGYVMAGILGAGALVGGFIAAKINRGAGLVAGAFTGCAMLCVLIPAAALRGTADLTALFFVKAAAALIGGAVGGILGIRGRS